MQNEAIKKLSEFEKNIASLLALPQKKHYDKTKKYPIAQINNQTIYMSEFLFAKQRGLIHNLQRHTDITIEYYKLLPYVLPYYQQKYLDTKSGRYIYIIDDNDGKKIAHVIDDEGFLLSIYISRQKEFKRFLKRAKLLNTNPDGEAPGSPILSPARAAFWRHPDLIEQLYHIFKNRFARPIYLFSISSHPEAIHINPLDITFFRPDIDFSLYEGFLLTSKQAIEALKRYAIDDFIHIPALCISKATQKAYEVIGGKVLATAKGYGDSLIEYVEKYPKTKRWLYLRAEFVASDFAKALRNKGYFIDEAVVYKSECSKEILKTPIPNDAILIFTSPSAIRCYLKTHELQPTQKIIAIGKTSAKTLPKGVDFIISPETSVQSCIEIAQKIRA